MQHIAVGDEVYSYTRQLFARVEEVFPAAVCVKVAILSLQPDVDVVIVPQLWRADDIENLSVCRYCGARQAIHLEAGTGIPFRVCERCGTVPPAERIHEIGCWW
jgi:ribosomal protein L40E